MQFVPTALCEGIVTHISKKNKDPQSCDFSHSISVCSVITNLFENNLPLKISNRCDQGDHQLSFRLGLGVGNRHAVFVSILEGHKRIKKPFNCLCN